MLEECGSRVHDSIDAAGAQLRAAIDTAVDAAHAKVVDIVGLRKAKLSLKAREFEVARQQMMIMLQRVPLGT